MSENIWESQLEINKIFDKRLALAGDQLTALTELVIAQGKLIQELAAPAVCKGRHCACREGEM
jgi:hypothetical protein